MTLSDNDVVLGKYDTKGLIIIDGKVQVFYNDFQAKPGVETEIVGQTEVPISMIGGKVDPKTIDTVYLEHIKRTPKIKLDNINLEYFEPFIEGDDLEFDLVSIRELKKSITEIQKLAEYSKKITEQVQLIESVLEEKK